jgi:DNA-directed RNA polymerase specialized sigma24 family protein
LDIRKLEALLEEIEPLSEKYKIIFYLAATGLYSADDLAEMFNHSPKNLTQISTKI